MEDVRQQEWAENAIFSGRTKSDVWRTAPKVLFPAVKSHLHELRSQYLYSIYVGHKCLQSIRFLETCN